MIVRHAALGICLLAVFASAAEAQTVNVTGTWSGQYQLTDRCADGSTLSFGGSASAQFIQSGSAAQGAVVLTDVLDTDGETCTPRGRATLTIPVSANVSGGALSGSFITPSGDRASFSGAVSGTSMNITFAQPVTSGSINLNQTSTTPPDSALSGTYTGSFTATDVPCGKFPPVTYSGQMSMSVLQTGSAVTGSVSLVGAKKDQCNQSQPNYGTLIDDPNAGAAFVGEVTGSTIVGVVFIEDEEPKQFRADVSGNTISGSVPGDLPAESFSFSVTRTTTGSPPPGIVEFHASPSTINAGASSTLSWSTVNASSVSIDNGAGGQGASGSVSVSPTKTTTYTLTATGIGGTSRATATVTVAGAGPRVAAGTFPTGMLQATGEAAATDSFSLANLGSDPASVSITASGNFFTVSPSSFTIAGGANQSVTIKATAQNAGSYDGSVTVTGDGINTPMVVPVRLLVAAAPTGSVHPQAGSARVDLSAPANQNPSGSVTFTNTGTAAMNGIAVADVPWITPQSGVITINPGETRSVSFTVDRSKRPDGASLFGGASGTIFLRFLGAAVSASRAISGTTPISTVGVTIVDVVKPGLTSGSPPPLGSGELALLIAGHGSGPGVAGDLLLSNRGSAPVPDLKLFLKAASQIATLPQLGANLGVTIPSVSTSVFGTEAAGTIMLRGTLDNVAAAALRMVNPSGAAAYFSATPVFRSDLGVGPGGRIVLPGVDKSATAVTTVIVQELSGNGASADIQGYDSNGAPIGSKNSISLGGFVSSNDANSIVEGARSVVVTNTSSGSARINAFARVMDTTTGDTWVIVDPSATSGQNDTWVMPMIATPAVPARTELYLTNASSSTVSATVAAVTSSSRRRAVRVTNQPLPPTTTSIRPLETQRTSFSPSPGYIKVSGAPGSISLSARVVMTSNGSFGSALPVLPVSAALGNGQVRRFSGVGDSSLQTVAAGTPATFRSSLVLIETTGQTATVRVTLWYTLPAGVAVSVQSVSSKTFRVGANQSVLVSDLGRTVIGSQRDAFGDLRDMQVDVEVVDGAGKVLPSITSIDNGTGDPVIRSE